jgi:hypothetical protein
MYILLSKKLAILGLLLIQFTKYHWMGNKPKIAVESKLYLKIQCLSKENTALLHYKVVSAF